MAKHTFQSWIDKWVSLTGRFRDNSDFEIAEDDYREFSLDIGESFFQPIDDLLNRVDKLEQPAPDAVDGVRWITAPKVSVTGANGTDVTVTTCEGEFDGVAKDYLAEVVHQAPKPQDGTTRVDILAAISTGWTYIYGEEDGVTPPFVHPTDPTIKMLFAAYLVWTSAGATVEDSGIYVKTVNGQAPDPTGNVNVASGKVDTVNGIQPDANKNILIEGKDLKSTANLWSYIGLTDSTALITLKGWLDFLTNKVKTAEDALAGKEKKIHKGTIAPASLAVDDLWIDTTAAPNVQKRWDGTVWVTVGSSATSPALQTISPDASNNISITVNTENPAIVSGGVTPVRVYVNITDSVFTKGRVLTIQGDGSTTPAIYDAVVYPGDAGYYKVGLGVVNKLWLTCDADAVGAKKVYYIWR
jgi:hypothetical protein